VYLSKMHNDSSAYGFRGGKRQYCATHKEDGMINLVSVTCAEDGCTKQPSYRTSLPEGTDFVRLTSSRTW
jgi:hypothetical protein